MSRRLEDDLGRWESGDLSLDDLRRLHPAGDVDALVALHSRFGTLVDEPTPDPAAAWAALGPALADAPSAPARRLWRSRKAAVAAVIAAALAVPTVAYAAAPDAVRSVVRQVRDLLPDGPGDDLAPTPGGADADGGAEDDDGPTTTTTTTGSPVVPPVSAGPAPIGEGDDAEMDDAESEVHAPDSPEAPEADDTDDGADDAPDEAPEDAPDDDAVDTGRADDAPELDADEPAGADDATRASDVDQDLVEDSGWPDIERSDD